MADEVKDEPESDKKPVLLDAEAIRKDGGDPAVLGLEPVRKIEKVDPAVASKAAGRSGPNAGRGGSGAKARAGAKARGGAKARAVKAKK